jgi:hypothetical protein
MKNMICKKLFRNYSLFILLLFCHILAIAQNKPNINVLDDAVVLIHIIDHEGNKVGHGSGFIIDSIGTVVTNYHVVDKAYTLRVITDINNFKEIHDVDKILTGDKSKDLVTISIKNNIKRSFPFLKLSNKIPVKGEDVWAIGTPAEEDYMNTVSKGLVSNLNFSFSPKLIQTNAEITHGSSGGALLNDKSEVIGITSSGDTTNDGSRASINFAISILELLNGLAPINKDRLIDPNKIPCKLSFYTNNPYVGDVYLYVDAVYIGKFTKYFPTLYKPNCGDDGTLTRFLYSGNHSYTVYFRNTGQFYYGNINLTPGECKIFNVLNPSENTVAPQVISSPIYSPQVNAYEYSPLTFRKKFDKKKYFDMALYSGYSTDIFSVLKSVDYTDGMLIPFTLFYEKSLKSNKMALRTNYNFLRYNNSKGNVGYNSVKLDWKLIWNRKYRWNYFFSPSFGFVNYKQREDWFEDIYDFNTGVMNKIHHEGSNVYSSLFLAGRIGLDRYTGKRFYITIDASYGTLFNEFYNNAVGNINFFIDFNILLGFRFHKIYD